MPESVFLLSALLAVIGFAVWIFVYVRIFQRQQKRKRYRKRVPKPTVTRWAEDNDSCGNGDSIESDEKER